MKTTDRLNVIFLLDNSRPNKVVLLKRASTKTYAPNWYTGIGGKIGDLPGLENETPLESAYRELKEETNNDLNDKNTTLKEFARCRYEDGLSLYYFWGVYKGDKLPYINPADGELIWAGTDKLLDFKIIPTTHEVCKEWAKRGFKVDKPFTVHLRHAGMDETIRLVELIKIQEGLV